MSHTLFTAPAESVLQAAPEIPSQYNVEGAWFFRQGQATGALFEAMDMEWDDSGNAEYIIETWVLREKYKKIAAAHVALLPPHFIHWIIVHPDHRRKGLASALIGRMVKDADLKIVQAICRDATDKERAFYRKLGFLETLTY